MSTKKKLLEAAAGNAGGGAGEYVEDVFSTYLYEGNGGTQTIENGIDLAGEGGMVWIKSRGSATFGDHRIYDTERGATYSLASNQTWDNTQLTTGLTSFNSSGFTHGSQDRGNQSGIDYASWTFRKAPKFFDVVTYTGNSSSSQTISHNLGVAPGMIITKATSATTNWYVYHVSLGNNTYAVLNLTESATVGHPIWDNTTPTSTEFTVGSQGYNTNNNGTSYVAYLFAHDESDESMIKCGSYTGTATVGLEIDLGFEPQFVLVKRANGTGNWMIQDNMRSINTTTTDILFPNLSNSPLTGNYPTIVPTATGFYLGDAGSNYNASGGEYIYMAIRRPNKPAESGTEVYAAVSASTNPYPTTVTSGFPIDMVIMGDLPSSWGYNWSVSDRLRSGKNVLFTSSTTAENTGSNTTLDSNTGLTNGWVSGGTTGLFQMFKRAPGFFDVVAYSGSAGYQDHGLGVIPELMIIKDRNPGVSPRGYWNVYHKDLGTTNAVFLNSTQGSTLVTDSVGLWFNTPPTDSFFYTGYTAAGYQTGSFGQPYIAYLFASVAGVSKVGSYTGTGNNINVDCGFSAGARFVMIKRTDSSGDWYVWDSVRGIVAGNDPYLLLNSTAAQVTNTDYVDPLASGFTVTSSAPAALNVSGGTYIFYAIA